MGFLDVNEFYNLDLNGEAERLRDFYNLDDANGEFDGSLELEDAVAVQRDFLDLGSRFCILIAVAIGVFGVFVRNVLLAREVEENKDASDLLVWFWLI